MSVNASSLFIICSGSKFPLTATCNIISNAPWKSVSIPSQLQCLIEDYLPFWSSGFSMNVVSFPSHGSSINSDTKTPIPLETSIWCPFLLSDTSHTARQFLNLPLFTKSSKVHFHLPTIVIIQWPGDLTSGKFLLSSFRIFQIFLKLLWVMLQELVFIWLHRYRGHSVVRNWVPFIGAYVDFSQLKRTITLPESIMSVFSSFIFCARLLLCHSAFWRILKTLKLNRWRQVERQRLWK